VIPINKTKFIGLRITEADYNKIKKKADEAKLNMSQFASLSVMGKDVLAFDDLKEMNRQLVKMGNNLNQLTMLVHQGRIKEVDLSTMREDLSTMLDKLCELVY